jgi:hypothetical protein
MHVRRILMPPVNDNRPSGLSRALRAAVFAVLGVVLAWLLHQL